jgi:hypothetical protein
LTDTDKGVKSPEELFDDEAQELQPGVQNEKQCVCWGVRTSRLRIWLAKSGSSQFKE